MCEFNMKLFRVYIKLATWYIESIKYCFYKCVTFLFVDFFTVTFFRLLIFELIICKSIIKINQLFLGFINIIYVQQYLLFCRPDDDTIANIHNIEPGGPGGGGESTSGMFVNPLTPQDFPALGGNETTVQRPITTVNFTSKVNSNFSRDDFPMLG